MHFDLQKPGIIYLLQNDDLGARKVGIANNAGARLSSYGSDWVIVYVAGHDVGRALKRSETALLNFLRLGHKLQPRVAAKDLPRGGASETFSSTEGPSNESLIELVDALLGYA